MMTLNVTDVGATARSLLHGNGNVLVHVLRHAGEGGRA